MSAEQLVTALVCAYVTQLDKKLGKKLTATAKPVSIQLVISLLVLYKHVEFCVWQLCQS